MLSLLTSSIFAAYSTIVLFSSTFAITCYPSFFSFIFSILFASSKLFERVRSWLVYIMVVHSLKLEISFFSLLNLELLIGLLPSFMSLLGLFNIFLVDAWLRIYFLLEDIKEFVDYLFSYLGFCFWITFCVYYVASSFEGILWEVTRADDLISFFDTEDVVFYLCSTPVATFSWETVAFLDFFSFTISPSLSLDFSFYLIFVPFRAAFVLTSCIKSLISVAKSQVSLTFSAPRLAVA